MTMNTSALKKFAQSARRQLLEQVAARMEQVLRTDSIEIREKAKAVKQLREEISASSEAAVIDKVAYTWFNRFCALRFMDVNHYTRIGVVSPIEGHTQPEVLADAKQGEIDASFEVDQARVFDLLNGQYPSSNPQQEAYRLLLKGACNALHDQMPFLFPKIDDYTELLMPDDLLSENSVLQGVRETLTPAACEDVEVIGWLYQYYISERKDEVFAALKKNQKIEADDIPAATQLFTPHWIVRYLVENSLGRLWLLNRPQSKLAAAMDYYIAPEQAETDFLQLGSPEEIKVADPACGSGHMLTYAFDLLYAIYEEEGYDSVEIPRLILEKNLYGIEIDERAGNLAAFALVMKARAKDRRFFRRKVEPNICVLENVHFSASELEAYKKKVGNDLFTQDLWFLLTQFEQADNFGSLIRPQVKHPEQMLARLEEVGVFSDLLLYSTNEKVKQVLKQAEYLSSRYHVVVANPPYMGSGGMNESFRDFSKDNFSESKSDSFAMFIERGFSFIHPHGYNAMVTMQSWMFLSSYETFRHKLLQEHTIVCMTHMSNMVMGIAFGTSATVWQNTQIPEYLGHYSYVSLDDMNNDGNPHEFPVKNHRLKTVQSTDFKKISGSPIAYWASEKVRNIFNQEKPIGEIAEPRQGMATGDNSRFVRLWHEVNVNKIGLGIQSKEDAHATNYSWFPFDKGGKFRKWYGNNEHLVKFDESAYKDLKQMGNHCPSEHLYFKPGVTWGAVTSGELSVRWDDYGFVFSNAGMKVFSTDASIRLLIIGLLNSKVTKSLIACLSETINFDQGIIKRIPVIRLSMNYEARIKQVIQLAKDDWDSQELSWDFIQTAILSNKKEKQLEKQYTTLKNERQTNLTKMQYLEEENNQAFIEAYGLEDELSQDVPLEEISLYYNPFYRYSTRKSAEELEALLLADTMQEFISYAVGCMFGRYSLEKPGLVLANQGEGVDDYRRQLERSGVAWNAVQFTPDEDNVIPILDGEWFADDIAERFKQFLKVTFGTEHYEENLAFLEEAIGRDIRSYFVKDFYNNHVKMYKKRPIYWLFSSPKGSFNALVYMHRYRPDTVSVILNGYLRQYREKLKAHKSHQEAIERNPGASQSEKTKALKEVDRINKVLAELKEYEDEVLYPLATQQLAIDLDDGVKANYPKFGDALKKVKGLSK
jgi:hypothetical protein